MLTMVNYPKLLQFSQRGFVSDELIARSTRIGGMEWVEWVEWVELGAWQTSRPEQKGVE